MNKKAKFSPVYSARARTVPGLRPSILESTWQTESAGSTTTALMSGHSLFLQAIAEHVNSSVDNTSDSSDNTRCNSTSSSIMSLNPASDYALLDPNITAANTIEYSSMQEFNDIGPLQNGLDYSGYTSYAIESNSPEHSHVENQAFQLQQDEFMNFLPQNITVNHQQEQESIHQKRLSMLYRTIQSTPYRLYSQPQLTDLAIFIPNFENRFVQRHESTNHQEIQQALDNHWSTNYHENQPEEYHNAQNQVSEQDINNILEQCRHNIRQSDSRDDIYFDSGFGGDNTVQADHTSLPSGTVQDMVLQDRYPSPYYIESPSISTLDRQLDEPLAGDKVDYLVVRAGWEVLMLTTSLALEYFKQKPNDSFYMSLETKVMTHIRHIERNFKDMYRDFDFGLSDIEAKGLTVSKRRNTEALKMFPKLLAEQSYNTSKAKGAAAVKSLPVLLEHIPRYLWIPREMFKDNKYIVEPFDAESFRREPQDMEFETFRTNREHDIENNMYEPFYSRKVPVKSYSHGKKAKQERTVKKSESYCGICCRWFPRDQSNWLHHMRSEHGIRSITRKPYLLPSYICLAPSKSIGYLKGYCERCHEWHDINSSLAKTNRWSAWYTCQSK